MDKADKEVLKALAQIAAGLLSLIAGIVFISLGTNLYIGLGVFFLIMYYNTTRGEK